MNENASIMNLYEQMLLQHNLALLQQQQQQQQQLPNDANSTAFMTNKLASKTLLSHNSSPLSTASSIISSKSQQSSPNTSTLNTTSSPSPINSVGLLSLTTSKASSTSKFQEIDSVENVSSKSISPLNSNPTNQTFGQTEQSYEAKCRSYMMNMAAAASFAAANSVFPYTFLGLPRSQQTPFPFPFHPAHLHQQQQQQHHQQQHLYFTNLVYQANLNSNLAKSTEPENELNPKPNDHLNEYEDREGEFDDSNSDENSSGNINNNLDKTEEQKPTHSYIGLIALAILSSPEKRLVLSDIYQWILDNYSYFHKRGSGWRNSIRHNLSLNDCFMKSGRSANGKGHYWTIHPANLEDFSRGDFRRRRAQRRVRKSMGLTVPEEDEEDEEEDELLMQSSASHFGNKSLFKSNASMSNGQSFKNPLNNIDAQSFNQITQIASIQSYLSQLSSNRLDAGCFYEDQSLNEPKKRRASQMFDQGADDDEDKQSQKSENLKISELKGNGEQSPRKLLKTENKATNNDNQASIGLKKGPEYQENDLEEDKHKVEKESNDEENLFSPTNLSSNNKRSFNVDSLLAPEKNSSKKLHYEQESNFNAPKGTPREKLNNNFKSKSNGQVANQSNLKHHYNHQHLSLSNKQESNNQDVEKWKETFSKIMARSYKNHK